MRAKTGVISIALLLTFFAAISYGPETSLFREVMVYLFGGGEIDPLRLELFYRTRLPRALAAAIVGGGLGLAATLLQSLTRNPLAEPGLIGVNAGAVLGMTLGLRFFHAASTEAYLMWAGGGALAAIILVLAIARSARQTSPSHLILIGIAITATLGGLANYILMASATTLEQFRFWNLGSLAGAKMSAIGQTLPWTVLAGIGTALLTPALTILQLGDDKASSMGVPTTAVIAGAWAAAAAFTASAVAMAGPVMFAGFLAAYTARWAAGPRLGWQLVYAAMCGTILMLVGDLIARALVQPFEIPVGVIISLIGTPLTLWVSRSRRWRGAMVSD